MSNPTGDALHAAGLEDKGGSVAPIVDHTDALHATLAKIKIEIGAMFKRHAKLPHKAA